MINMELYHLKTWRKKDDKLYETIMNHISSMVSYFEYKYHYYDESIFCSGTNMIYHTQCWMSALHRIVWYQLKSLFAEVH